MKLSKGRGQKGRVNLPYLNEDWGKTRDKIGARVGSIRKKKKIQTGRNIESEASSRRFGNRKMRKRLEEG